MPPLLTDPGAWLYGWRRILFAGLLGSVLAWLFTLA